MQTALIAVGSNCRMGDITPESLVKRAFERLQCDLASQAVFSSFFQTPAFPEGSGPAFVNAAAAVQTDLPAQVILDRLHRIEADLGRVRVQRWGPRTLDLDLIGLGGQVAPDRATLRQWIDLPPADQQTQVPDRLILPHPRFQDRAFVLVPLAQVAPDWCHPLTGLSVVQMLEALTRAEREAVVPL